MMLMFCRFNEERIIIIIHDHGVEFLPDRHSLQTERGAPGPKLLELLVLELLEFLRLLHLPSVDEVAMCLLRVVRRRSSLHARVIPSLNMDMDPHLYLHNIMSKS